MINDLNCALDILLSDSKSLSELCSLTGMDKFTFFQGADLSGLDLSGQDLSGLNFSGATLLHTNLNNVVYDAGSFNGASLSSEYNFLTDEFDFFIDDIMNENVGRLHLYVKFRPRYLDMLIKALGLTAFEFKGFCNIGLDTLRKARHSKIVAPDTALAICRAIDCLMQDRSLSAKGAYRQPCIELLENSGMASFEHITRRDVFELIKSGIENGGWSYIQDYRGRTTFHLAKIFAASNSGFHRLADGDSVQIYGNSIVD